MIIKRILIAAVPLSLALTTGAFALGTDVGQTPARPAHRHHVAKHVNPNTASDVDRDAGMYVVKPQNDPEYFGHGTGSDGSVGR